MTKKKWIIGILAVVALLFLYRRYNESKNESGIEKSLMHSYVSSYQGIDINKKGDKNTPVAENIPASNISVSESMGAPVGSDAIGGGNVGKKPTKAPTKVPSQAPTMTPTMTQALVVTTEPTEVPEEVPTQAPTTETIEIPTGTPTTEPTPPMFVVLPTAFPVLVPTTAPIIQPTVPVIMPTVPTMVTPTVPAKVPTVTSTLVPTNVPSMTLTKAPTATVAPTLEPTPTAIIMPTIKPIATTVPTLVPNRELVSAGYYDYNIIPDKYNTGCTNTAILTKINSATIVDGIEYNMGSGGTTVVIDLYYRNENMPEEVVIRNKDFSDKSFSVWHASRLEPGTKRVIRFENCKFSFASVEFAQDNAKYYFTNCSFVNFKGSDSTFEKCFFGGSFYDGMNPYKNVTVKNCYFGGFVQHNNEGKHSDALQIYGKEGTDAENIFYKNCRIEIPIIKSEQKPQINACLMVQLEYSSANGIMFEDCIINGGGFSIYVIGTKKDITLRNVVFRNIAIGSAHLYGDLHPNYDKNAVFDNLYDTEKLYVGSVWKDASGKVHLSVSNDTAKDRVLVVVTEAGKEEIRIECKTSAEAAGARETEDLPIDLDVVIGDGDTDWVVCYDGEETEDNQIRFVNWSGESVYREIN